MARARNIKPGFFHNADLVELPFETRLLFIGLWTLADREGRLEDRPKQIKMELFPVDQCDVCSMLEQLQTSGFIVRYEVDSSRFIEVCNFIKHQDPHYKEKASEIPPPAGKENFIKATGVTRTQRNRILERDKFTCVSCGMTDNLCIDHVMPVSRGGDSSDDNLQVLCGSCNTKKGNKINGESKNSRQRRINVDPNLNQRNDASPSDSLIPDSGFLIPDPCSSKLHHETTSTGETDPDGDAPAPVPPPPPASETPPAEKTTTLPPATPIADAVTVRAVSIAVLLRQRGAGVTAGDPRLRSWAERGIGDAALLLALETAERRRAQSGNLNPVNAGLLDAILGDVHAPPSRASPHGRQGERERYAASAAASQQRLKINTGANLERIEHDITGQSARLA